MRFQLLAATLASSLCLTTIPVVQAADKNAWRTRSVYQLLTDRFAPVSPAAPALTPNLPKECTTGARKYCGGTWRSIIEKLDYIQGMGFDAIWISPVHQNLEGTTPYGEAYHAHVFDRFFLFHAFDADFDLATRYWVTDVTKLNPHFGNASDLQALSKAVHDRGMLLMVDIAVNFVASLSTDISEASLSAQKLPFARSEFYHPLCWIDYNSQDSIERCWMGDGKVPLMDLNTENVQVQNTLNKMIKDLVTTYRIDGLRIDAAKHVPKPFWTKFCGAAGVFCTGEAYSSDTAFVADYQKSKSLDSLINFPAFFNGMKNAFQVPGRANMKDLGEAMTTVVNQFPDPGVNLVFLSSHDVSRLRSVTSSDTVAHNALVWQFMFDGIPCNYYGEEQEITSGLADPDQRQALWASGMGGYSRTTNTYKRIGKLNTLRKFLMSGTAKLATGTPGYPNERSRVIFSSKTDLVFIKGPIIVYLNNRVSSNAPVSLSLPSTVSSSRFQGELFDALSCRKITISANNTLVVTNTNPMVIMTRVNVAASKLCPGL